jgi:hypothetical protein
MRALRTFLLALSCACAIGQWQSVPAEHPVSRAELSYLRVTVIGSAELAEALARQGFVVVEHPAWHGDLQLRFENGVAHLTSDGYFVDELRGEDQEQLAERIARSRRIAEFVRNSGTVEQRSVPGM